LLPSTAPGLEKADYDEYTKSKEYQMNIKLITSVFSLIAASASATAVAADYDDFAKVTNVTPQIEQINRPRQECKTEYVQVNRQVQTQQQQPRSGERSNGGAVVGGIAGAILGNQVGRGNGRTAATAAGAVIGAITGDRIDNGSNSGNSQPVTETITSEQPVQRCRAVDHWESRTTGYSVNYEYKGRSYNAILPYDPGTRLKVNISVTPAQQ
jgi:uncharacterized protein YcfJ